MNGVLRGSLVTVLLLPALSSGQEARPQSGFDYSYVELGYDESDFEVGGGEVDGDGFTLSGSFELNDGWHVFASYGNADLDFGIDLDTWAIGAGYAFAVKDDVDIYGRVLYIDTEADLPGPGSADEDGLGLQLRVRGRVNQDFELEGGVQYVDVGDSDTSLQAGGRYYLRDNFSVGIGLTFGGDTDGIGVNARFSF